MNKKLSVTIIIPVYNEGENIVYVVNNLKNELNKVPIEYEIIVVDDGSNDNTKEVLKSLSKENIKIITHPENMGYGEAILTGIKNAKYEYIATIDADGSYLAEDLVNLISEIEGYDLVIGARKGKEFWGSMLKHPARILFLFLAEFTVGEKIPDVNSGLRIFKKSSFLELKFPAICRGFSFSSTMTLAFLAEGKFVKFVPISYLPRKGKSKVNYIRDTLRTLQVLVEIITFYNPLKLIIIIMVPLIILSILWLLLWILTKNFYYGTYFNITFVSSVLIFVIGLLMDLIRMKK
jgi:glycosyltransferase involved in cell wall biosynthesis